MTRMVKGLKGKTQKEKLKSLVLFSLQRAEKDLTGVCRSLVGAVEQSC